VLGKVFGDIRPACTVMVVGLVDSKMKIEIEVTALRSKATPRKKKAKAKAVRRKK
jgi:hypothetical protein